MTIKDFSKLCSCGTQTLRYYDRIGLLKPARVDPWSGYRYYEPRQAIDFVKIKNLQTADFSISEIKLLLTKSDEQIYEAFAEKITAQEQKLEKIIEIQKTYLSEKTNMERIIQGMSDFVLSGLSDFETLREFGLQPEDRGLIIDKIRSYMQQLMLQDLGSSEKLRLRVNDEVYTGAEQIAEKLSSLRVENLYDTITLNDSDEPEEEFSPGDYDLIWEMHGWSHVYEFIDQMPLPENDGEYYYHFGLDEAKYDAALSYPLFMLGYVTLKKGDEAVIMGSGAEKSPDGQNHFSLMRRKQC